MKEILNTKAEISEVEARKKREERNQLNEKVAF